MQSFEKTIDKLRREGFKLTLQRMAVIKYMLGNREHPSALAIHRELKRRYRSLSFSTVYNTLNVLGQIDEVQPLHIMDGQLNYDPNTEPHFHFYCNGCGTIHDIFMDEHGEIRVPEKEIEGHAIDSCQVVFRGTCRNCLQEGNF